VKEGQAITIEAICHKSAQIDAQGRGVKKSAVLENQEAHALRIDPHRDVDRARSRYLQITKPALVERLLQVEQAYAELAEAQAHLQFTWAELELRSVSERKQERRS
jgi:hypothetical protein